MHIKKKKSRMKFIIFMIIALIASYAVYFFLLNPKNIICGIYIDKKVSSRYTELQLYNNGKIQKILLNNKIVFEEADAYNVKLRGLRVISILPCNTYTGKVLSRDTRNIETENGKYPLKDDITYIKLEDKTITPVTQNNIIVGYSYKLISDNNGKIGAVIVGKPLMSLTLNS
jgi:hypothetical protein